MTASVMFDQNFEPQKEVGKETLDFIMKLQTNPANASLHIEPINGSVDKRVRTGRVTLQYRAVLVELNGKDGKHFLVLAVMNHDDAIAYAKKVKVGVNAVNGNFEITQEAAAPDHVDVEAEIVEAFDTLPDAPAFRFGEHFGCGEFVPERAVGGDDAVGDRDGVDGLVEASA